MAIPQHWLRLRLGALSCTLVARNRALVEATVPVGAHLRQRERHNKMSEEQPLLDTVMEMTAASMSNSSLGARELMLVRLAALAAVDAPPASYLLNLAAAVDAGLTLEDARGVLIAVAPIIGTPRTVAATGAIARALGFALDVEQAIEDAQA